MKHVLIAAFVLGACILSFSLGRQFERVGGLPTCSAPCAAWLRHELRKAGADAVVVDSGGRAISSVEGPHDGDILVLHSEE